MASISKYGGEFRVNTTTVGAQNHSAITAFADGRFVVAWSDDSSSNGDVRAQIFNAAGSKLGSEFLVNSTTADTQRSPTVAALEDGQFVAVWIDLSSFPYYAVRAQIFDSGGAKVGMELLANTAVTTPVGFLDESHVTALLDGKFVATWWEWIPVHSDPYQNDDVIMVQMFNQDGSKSGGQFVANTNITDRQAESVVSALTNGRFVVAWVQFKLEPGTPASDYAILAQIFNPDGTRFGSELRLDPVAGSIPAIPSLAALPEGRFVVTYDSQVSNEDEDIRAQIFAADGSKSGGDFLVNATTEGKQGHPVAATLLDGRFVVAWEDNSETGGDTSTGAVRAQLFNADGSKSGTEFLVNTQTEGVQAQPAVASLPDGRFVVTWTDESHSAGDRSWTAVHAQIFDPRETAVNLVGTPLGDDFVGTGFNDTLIGNGGDDRLTGAGGNDRLAGGAGDDRALFASARADYFVRTFDLSGTLVTIVADQGGTPVDGLDTLTGIEHLEFGNGPFRLLGAQLNHLSNVDGDRFDDVLFQNATTGQVYFAKMVTGAFQSWGLVTDPLGTDWKAVASGDVNPGPTGGAETFVQQQSTGAISYASRDTGATTWVSFIAPGADWKLRAVADVNGDATADVLLQNETTGAIKLAPIFSGLGFQGYGTVSDHLTPDWRLVGAGDINRDGLADAVIQQQSTGTIYYAVMDHGIFFQSWNLVSQNLTPDWKVKAVADVSGDGFADVIVQQASTGTTYFADMKNGAFDHWGVVTANVTSDWVVQGTADVDNDGFADVLFQNRTNGTTYYANMGPAGFEGWGTVASNISPEWQVV